MSSSTSSNARRSRLSRTVNHLAPEATISLQEHQEELRKKHPMRGDSLMHVCHLHQSQACWNIEKVLEFGSLECAMICGMAPDPKTDDHTLRLYQKASSSVRNGLFPGLSGFHIDDAGIESYVA